MPRDRNPTPRKAHEAGASPGEGEEGASDHLLILDS